MHNILIQKASELKPQTRAAVEAELGRALQDDEDVSIMACSSHESPAGDARREAAQKLRAHFERVDSLNLDADEKDAEDALNEALRHVRPGYRERE
jgi:hypothetical protein